MVLVKILLVGGRSIADSDLAFYHAVIPYATRIALPPEDVDTWMNDEVLRTVVAKTASYWSKIGVEAPHWSVLTTDKFGRANLRRTTRSSTTAARSIAALFAIC
jgi:hypothetical protein